MKQFLVGLCALAFLTFPLPAFAVPTATLTWTDTNSGLAAYVIKRRLGGGVYTGDLATTTLGATTYADTTISAGQVYCYSIAAISGTTRSVYAPEVCGALLNAPGGVTITIVP